MKGKIPLFLRLTLAFTLAFLFLPIVASTVVTAAPATSGPVLVGQGIVAPAAQTIAYKIEQTTPSAALSVAYTDTSQTVTITTTPVFADTGQPALTIEAAPTATVDTTSAANVVAVQAVATTTQSTGTINGWAIIIVVALIALTLLAFTRRRIAYFGASLGGGSHSGSSGHSSGQIQGGLRFWRLIKPIGTTHGSGPLPERKEKG